MLIPPVEKLLGEWGTEHVVIAGLESHVCVEQTVTALLRRGVTVDLLADGVSSMRPWERHLALLRMHQAGAQLSSLETCLFQLLHSADNPLFKEIQNLVKGDRPPSGLNFGAYQ